MDDIDVKSAALGVVPIHMDDNNGISRSIAALRRDEMAGVARLDELIGLKS